MSVPGSEPINVAFSFRPSFKVTASSSASSMTWLLVTMYPSFEIITPDPVAICSFF